MKRISTLLLMCLFSLSFAMAQDETGFGTSADFMIGYKEKTVSTMIGYDFGYKVIPSLYIGAGPMVGASFGNGSSAFSGGGYGKLRFTVPIDFSIRPFVDARAGYSYSFSDSKGNMIYGTGLGVRFSDRFCLGIYCNITKSSWEEQESYISGYEKRYNKVDKKYHSVPVYGKRTVNKSKTNYIPSLLLSINF